MGPLPLKPRQNSWTATRLVLGVVALVVVDVGLIAGVFFGFGDIILTFFLAWLLAFILSPIVPGLERFLPFLPRVVATSLVSAALVSVIVILLIVLAGALAGSIGSFVASVPTLREELPRILADWQGGANAPAPPADPARRAHH